MKVRKMIGVATILLFCAGLLIPITANAAVEWVTGTVVTANYVNGNVQIRINSTDKAAERTFTAASGDENRILAIGMTAMQGGNEVQLKVNWTVAESDILGIRLLEAP